MYPVLAQDDLNRHPTPPAPRLPTVPTPTSTAVKNDTWPLGHVKSPPAWHLWSRTARRPAGRDDRQYQPNRQKATPTREKSDARDPELSGSHFRARRREPTDDGPKRWYTVFNRSCYNDNGLSLGQ